MGLSISVYPEVFHPNWFATSQLLLEYLECVELKGKKFLELGCGTGTQACRAVQKGALSYASDITNSSCKNAAQNARENDLDLIVIHSDVFDQFPAESRFDYIFVNPPFKNKYPEEDVDFAYFCGEQYEYYQDLFRQLPKRLSPDGKLIMALAESCNCDKINEMARNSGFEMKLIQEKRKWGETNYIIQISFINS